MTISLLLQVSWSDASTSILGKQYVDNKLLFNLTCLLSF